MNVMWVGSEYERTGIEPLGRELAQMGLTLLPEKTFSSGEGPETTGPVLVLALLSGDLDRDTAVCRQLAGRTTAPIIAISATARESYLLAIFDTGVDDFILRPIKTHELAARIRTILRRTQPGRASQPAQAATETAPPDNPVPPPGMPRAGISKSIQTLVSRLFSSAAA